jgi:hypothetical protein
VTNGSAWVPGEANASKLAPETSVTAAKTRMPIIILFFKTKNLHTEDEKVPTPKHSTRTTPIMQ